MQHPRLSPQHAEIQQRPPSKAGSIKRINSKLPEAENIKEEMLREAEVVTGYLYGNRSRAAAQALLIHRYNNGRDEKPKDPVKPTAANNLFNIYYVGNNKDQRHKVLQRGLTTTNTSSSKPATCSSDTCDFWPHCASRESLNNSMMRLSQSYPTNQKSLESSVPENTRPNSVVLERTRQDAQKKRFNRCDTEPKTTSRRPTILYDETQDKNDNRLRIERRPSPNRNSVFVPNVEKKISPVNVARFGNASSSSSSSDVYLTTSDRTTSKSPKNVKSSGASTPLEDISCKDEKCREEIVSRPGSAPNDENKQGKVENQQRSMSLPKSFLSASYHPR